MTSTDTGLRADADAAPQRSGRPRAQTAPHRRKEALTFYLFISPWIIGFVGFLLGPMLFSIYLSFTRWDSFTAPVWVGLDNYITLLTDDPIFLRVMGNTAYYSLISVPLGMVVSLFIANLLNKKVRFRKVFRTLVYLPHLIPIVAVALIFQMVFAPEAGPLNQALAMVGIEGPNWLMDENWVKPALILMSLWQAGGGTILLLAGMNGIPKEMYEAAEIDGAGGMRQFWSVTFPQLTPVIFFNLIMGIIGSFQVFAQVFILTGGGPDNASQMAVPMLFDEAFRFYHMGYGSAIAWILFVVIMAFTALAFATSGRWVFYESEVRS
ncbi:carbohydrate ABC transporter permease [Brachybacterium saurashtrense]|uniref:Sugar ABC transporter permease n=1 Tax=Brachybacterium saurashtrense TaxID=556288 RepID=A0A345YQX7_9MICO|nr:sugar ABC transporter permease [Brachybacterium saurashtrense]AXK46329.1 sugar ABC transporter permease [Brachybacterium saurashtrense]RRR24069.1 sugar ABC transporter permease [Brachybacterium saurashtrense]